MNKLCCHCKVVKPLDAFHSKKGRCKVCVSVAKKARYWADPEAARAKSRQSLQNYRSNHAHQTCACEFTVNAKTPPADIGEWNPSHGTEDDPRIGEDPQEGP